MNQQSDGDNRAAGSLHGARRAVLVVVAAVVGINVLVFGTLLGFGALPFQFKPASAPAAAAPPTVTGAETAASQAVTSTVAIEIDGYSAPAPTEVGAGTMPVYPCSLNPPTQPAFGRYRTFSSADRSVPVTVSAYGTGAGPWVMENLAAQLSQCGDRRGEVTEAVGANGLGVQAVQAGVPQGVVILIRRGDLIITAIGQDPDVLKVSVALDAALGEALDACVDPVGVLGDETRNPWLPGVTYQGLRVDSEVKVPAVGAPAPPDGVEAVALDAPAANLPAVYRPARPADPVWPLDLPAEMAAPTAPASPGVEPTKTVIKVPQVDRLGPGCGWAFTNTTPPVVNETQINEERQQLRATAEEELRAQQQAWQLAVSTYFQQWADYRLRVQAYNVYAQEVATVAGAWQKINNDRNAYATALRQYQAAVAARDTFLIDRQAAAAEYQRQLAICAVPLPSPSPTPSPPPSPSPSPTPTPAPDPTGTDAPSPSPASLTDDGRVRLAGWRLPADPRPGCPPARPAILDRQPPTVPPAPTPPPDPRPVEFRN